MTRSEGDESRRLRAKYLRLGVGELAAAFVFCVVAVSEIAPHFDGSAAIAWWLAFAPLIAVLVQAGVFWLLARIWVLRRPMPVGLARVYVTFGVLDVLLLLMGLTGIALWSPSRWALAGLAAVWVFGAVEFVNYFVVRLAYPIGSWFDRVRRLERPRLIVDVRHGLSPD